jgi:flavin reductase (DIM6/NTAB) family NADH-FMN oxidoreductase RutF
MPIRKKRSLPVNQVRRFMEPGPIVLVSSAHKGETNIMTMGWHMMDEYDGIACYIWDQNHSRSLITKSRECVFNIPEVVLAPTVVKIGNCSGRDVDKFAEFGLTAVAADEVGAPLIAECFASFECRLIETSLVRRYSLLIFEVVKAHVAPSPKYPRTIHYRGDGHFMISGEETSRWRKLFRPDMLEN